MSVDISWDTITQGPDGEALAEKIRDFLHDRFQQVPLPRFIKSVQVHSFGFGTNCPEVEIIDISDPLPDFYDDDENDDEDGEDKEDDISPLPVPSATGRINRPVNRGPGTPGAVQTQLGPDLGHKQKFHDLQTTQFTRSNSPGIPGGTSNFSYLHLPMGGRSGTQTPLAAVAGGGPLSPIGWHHEFPFSSLAQYASHSNAINQPLARPGTQQEDPDPTTRPSTANTIGSPSDLESASNPASPELLPYAYPPAEAKDDVTKAFAEAEPNLKTSPVQSSDVQVVARVQYSGDVRMTLTADILLDYPSQSFVGIPLKLSITGMSFDGVAILAYTRKRMHFCFLDRDDAQTVLGSQAGQTDDPVDHRKGNASSLSGPLREIHVESEIGRQESGKPVLKNVGKVEKFVLEQIRRIFEDEFIFPSFWTILV